MLRSAKSPVDRDNALNQMRQTFFEESKLDPYHPRYGLFSYPGTLAISKQPYEIKIIPGRDDQGKPQTQPRNFQTSPVKEGKSYDAYLSKPVFHTINDPYTNQPPPWAAERERAMKAKTVHEAQFKPGGGPFKEPYAPYDHMSDLNDKKKNHRDAEGNVILEPFNFVTSPAKKGNPNNYPNTGFSKQHEYMPDPYSRKNDFAREELKRDIAKRQEAPFRNTHYGNRPFNPDEKVFQDYQIKHPPRRPLGQPNKYPHEGNFKPSNPPKTSVMDKTLAKFPEWKPNTAKPAAQRKKIEVPWRRTYIERSKPSPSVNAMRTNVRASFIRSAARLR